MENHEIEADFKKVIDYFTGVTSALMVLIRGLQAQPGYQHSIFQSHLAAMQVAGEKFECADSSLRGRVYQETLEKFGTPIGNAEPPAP